MFLEKIVIATRKRIEVEKERKPMAEVEALAFQIQREYRGFQEALQKPGMSFICEIKKASPSKGMIAENFPYLEIAREYAKAGADAISVLTEPDFFKGDIRHLEEIVDKVEAPLLRKDFILDRYQIYQAKTAGASAILLISELLTTSIMQTFIRVAEELDLDVLVESHSEEPLKRALDAGAKIIGVNNRNLETFVVNMTTSLHLSSFVPKECILVSESGIQTREEVKRLEEAGVDAVLVGETLMRSNEKTQLLQKLRGL